DFTDGQTHFDILKCMIFVLAEVLPAKCPLIPCLRALLQFRMMTGLRAMTESRLTATDGFIKRYEKCCQKVSESYDKNFAFPKQHFLVHALDDVRAKGVLRNATTRTGEGVHQEVAQHYMQTNSREAEAQIAHRDEEQEAVARTRMVVDDFLKVMRNEGMVSDDDAGLHQEAQQFRDGVGRRIPRSKISPGSPANDWILGSALRSGDSRSYEDLHARDDPLFRDFDPRLRDFLHSPGDTGLRVEDSFQLKNFQIEIFRCLYISYQSRDDWKAGEDILRCNANWYRRGPRYDCLLFNSADASLACARLRSLIRCKLPSGRIVDVAMVNSMRRSTWRSRNHWDGSVVFDEDKGLAFLLIDHVIRGALLAPVNPPPASKPRLHFLVDVVDGDMFLRCLNADTHVCY
ncbi:hypothetical protein GGX14DRAFT_353256, partial [Mycena pura]